jgi:hypothetical protein
VAADRGQNKGVLNVGQRILGKSWGRQEVRFAVGGVPPAKRGGDIQPEAAWLAHALVELGKVGEDFLDLVADPAIVRDNAPPIDAMSVAERSFGDPRDDRRLGSDEFAGRVQEASRRVNHGHRILDGDGLRAG